MFQNTTISTTKLIQIYAYEYQCSLDITLDKSLLYSKHFSHLSYRPFFGPHHQLRGLALKHYIIRGTDFSFKYIKIQTKIKNIYSDSNDEEVLKYFFCYAPFMLMSLIFLMQQWWHYQYTNMDDVSRKY